MEFITEDQDIVLISSAEKALTVNSEKIPLKTTRSSQGVTVMTLRKNAVLKDMYLTANCKIANLPTYRPRNIPAAGTLIKAEDKGIEQITFSLDDMNE